MQLLRTSAAMLLAAAIAFTLTGCARNKPHAALKQESVSLGDNFDESLLILGTARLLAEGYVNMVTTSGEAARATEQPSVREGSIRWRIMTAGRLDRVRAIADPRLRFAAIWTLAVQMRFGFTEGEDKSRFGDQQYRYQDFAAAFEKNVVEVGYRAFPDQVIEQVKPEVENVARTVGVTGWFTPEAARTVRNPLSQLMSVPLSPISGLQGVGDTPAAINRFTDAAREMTRVVENLPERTRWQIELMLLEAESQGVVSSALKELEETRKTIEQVSTRFPQQTRELLADPKLAENLDRIHSTIQLAGEVSSQFSATLAEFRQSVAEIRQTLLETQQAGSAVEKAASAIQQTTEVIRKDGDNQLAASRPAIDDKDEFRITDVEAAAARVESAAAEIRHVIADLRTEGAVPALDLGAERADRFVRTVTWSVALLIGIAFAAGLGLILIWRLMNRRKPHP